MTDLEITSLVMFTVRAGATVQFQGRLWSQEAVAGPPGVPLDSDPSQTGFTDHNAGNSRGRGDWAPRCSPANSKDYWNKRAMYKVLK